VDKDSARRLAFYTLAHDGGGGAENLDEILPLLDQDLPREAIWREIELYISVLFDGLHLVEEPTGFGTSPEDDTAARAISEIISTNLNHSCPFVAQSAQRTAGMLLLANSQAMFSAVDQVLRDRSGYPDAALLLLVALGRRTPRAVEGFREAVAALSDDPSYSIRTSVREIARNAGWDIDLETRETRPLRVVYDLDLAPAHHDLVFDRPISSGAVLPDSEEPATLLRPFTDEFNTLAEEVSIPKANLYQRAIQIMYELALRSRWSAAGEQRLRTILDSAGLRFPFRRPRAQLARRALFYVLAELVDAGRLASASVSRLAPILTFDDADLLLQQPLKRPREIACISRGDDNRGDNREWIERIEEVRAIVRSNLNDGWVVIGEFTTLKLLEREVPTEQRFSRLSLHESHSTRDFFQNIPAIAIENYPALDSFSSLIIRNHVYTYDTAGSDWLAFNPSIARRLGWRPSDEHPLAWVDSSGNSLVETIWWTDGMMHHQASSWDDEVGEGWLVAARPHAYETLKREYPDLCRISRVRRSFESEGTVERRIIDWTDGSPL
jgi:hypothetical protein